MSETRNRFDLNGEFRFKVDAKGRIQMPAKFRKVLSNDLVVSISPHDECLWVFEPVEFDAWVEQVFIDRFGGYNSSSRLHQGLRRKLKRRARDVEVDSAGRIMLPADMREAVGIDKDVVIIGNTGYFEVFDAKRCDEVEKLYDFDELFD